MEQRGIQPPSFFPFQHPENHPLPPFTHPAYHSPQTIFFSDDDQSLSLAFSTLNIDNNNNNVQLSRTQNECFLGGPHTDFLVDPHPRLNFYDVLQRTNEIVTCSRMFLGDSHTRFPPRFNFYDVFQRTNENVACSGMTKKIDDFEAFCIKDLKGRIVLLAKDRRWSKVLERKIEGQSVEDNEFVVGEVMDYVCDLMKNQFGGYFIEKLFGVCDEEQRTRIIVSATSVSFELVNVCLSSHGAKTVQTLMENLNTPQQISLVICALYPGVVVLSSDPNGQHVIQCCLTNFSYEFNKLLLEKIIQNCNQIVTNKCGCCLLQSCVDYSRGEHRKFLIGKIIANAICLAQDPFGNYLVQHLLGLGMPEITADLIRHFRGKFTSLSCNKFASNVVEKLLLELGEEYATFIIEDLLENSQAASMLLIDPYGNFVIQTALTVSKGEVFKKVLRLIVENAASMRNNIYAAKIFDWFDKRNLSLGKYMYY